jgi:hypothetical protein
MAYELVGQHRCICFYLNQVDRHSRYLGEDDSTDGIREGEFNILKFEVNMMCSSLPRA